MVKVRGWSRFKVRSCKGWGYERTKIMKRRIKAMKRVTKWGVTKESNVEPATE